MKVKLNLTNLTLEYLDSVPYIQGEDSRNQLIVYVPEDVTTNIAISYQLQNGRNTIKMANSGTVAGDDANYMANYDGFIFIAPKALTCLSGNFMASVILTSGTTTYKFNVLNTVLNSVEFEAFETALEESESEFLDNITAIEASITSLQTNKADRTNTSQTITAGKYVVGNNDLQIFDDELSFKSSWQITNTSAESYIYVDDNIELNSLYGDGENSELYIKDKLQFKNSEYDASNPLLLVDKDKFQYGNFFFKGFKYDNTTNRFDIKVVAGDVFRIDGSFNGFVALSYGDASLVFDSTNHMMKYKNSELLTKANVVDNLTTQTTNVPLSAKQGYVLKGLIDDEVSNRQSADTTLQTKIDASGHKIELNLNSTNFQMYATLKDKNNNVISTSQIIDLPLESVVVSGSYDAVNKKVVLTLENGSTIEFSVADLIDGLQNEITSQNPLYSDLVTDENQTHKFVTASEKAQITTNANNIEDLQGLIGYVEISSNTGILTDAQFAEVQKDYCIINYGGYLYYKTSTTNDIVIFEGITQMAEVDSSKFALAKSKLLVTISDKSYEDNNKSKISYTSSSVDTLINNIFLTDAEMTTMLSEVFD